MDNVRVFHAAAMGESHKAKNIPCQDAAGSFEDDEKGIYIAAISDGHGNERHFMSQYGSKILIDIAIDSVKNFLSNNACNILSVEYATSGMLKVDEKNEMSQKQKTKENVEQNRIITNLISSIISQWNVEIENHWKNNLPNRDEMIKRNVPLDAIDDYLQGENLENAYGCTLIVFVKTNNFWLAFQIGDGACISFLENADVFYPIPSDERFSGSITASMCNSDALDNFRFGYGNTQIPIAVFVGSDGLDGVFGTISEMSMPRLEHLYANIVKTFNNEGFDNAFKEIEKSLPELSAKGVTRDDMSLAGIVDFDRLKTSYPLFLEKEICRINKEIDAKEAEYQEYIQKIEEKKIELDCKNTEHESLKKMIPELKVSLLDAEAEMKKMKKKADFVTNEINEKILQLNNVVNNISKIEDNIRISESSVEGLKSAKQRLVKKLVDIKHELNQFANSKEPIENTSKNIIDSENDVL